MAEPNADKGNWVRVKTKESRRIVQHTITKWKCKYKYNCKFKMIDQHKYKLSNPEWSPLSKKINYFFLWHWFLYKSSSQIGGVTRKQNSASTLIEDRHNSMRLAESTDLPRWWQRGVRSTWSSSPSSSSSARSTSSTWCWLSSPWATRKKQSWWLWWAHIYLASSWSRSWLMIIIIVVFIMVIIMVMIIITPN